MKIRGNIAVKTVAFFLAVVLLLSTVFFGACIAAAGFLGVYTGDFKENKSEIIEHILREYAEEVASAHIDGYDLGKKYTDCNFFFELEASDGVQISTAQNMPKNLPSATVNLHRETYIEQNGDGYIYYILYGGVHHEAFYTNGEEIDFSAYPEHISVTVYEKAARYNSDWLTLAHFWLDAVYNMRTLSIILASSSLVLLIAVWIFLFCTAGYRTKEKEPRLNFLDRIPFDLFTAICVGLFIGFFGLFWWLCELVAYNNVGDFSTQMTFVVAICICIVICAVIEYLLVLGYLLSFATRIKVGGLIKRTLVYIVIAFVCRMAYKLFASIPLVWKTHLLLFAVSATELLLLIINVYEPDNLILFFVLGKFIEIPFFVWIALMLRKLKKSGEAIAAGKISEKVDTRLMPLDFGDFGRTLNNIGNGLEGAVEEKMRSERLKTELITNVSHDIKTPLTSIVNYVDLIKKEEIESEKVREYVDVLDRHSARLKKLIEDLVEASKASTGNISVELERCDIGVCLTQSIGEYSERLSEREITPVVSQPDEPIFIMADGRRLWRVLDNLLCNICKYAMPKTRAYVTLEQKGGKALLVFKNISAAELNISADELTERFVRGDASRNTEGSGLGLSIARSLTELQGGSLDISVDGDLFKATLTFPTVK